MTSDRIKTEAQMWGSLITLGIAGLIWLVFNGISTIGVWLVSP